MLKKGNFTVCRPNVSQRQLFLYVRGHAIYNLVNSIGEKLCEGSDIDFEQNILKSLLPFDGYDALSKIKNDIAILNTLPHSL